MGKEEWKQKKQDWMDDSSSDDSSSDSESESSDDEKKTINVVDEDVINVVKVENEDPEWFEGSLHEIEAKKAEWDHEEWNVMSEDQKKEWRDKKQDWLKD